MNSRLYLLIGLIFIISLNSEGNNKQDSKFKIYSSNEMGFTFHYPINWTVKEESLYQTAAEASEKRKNPHPPVLLCDTITNDCIEINGRQCPVEFKLHVKGYTICLSQAADTIGHHPGEIMVDKTNKSKYLSSRVIFAVEMIDSSFTILKEK
jgi:hypothetical protein